MSKHFSFGYFVGVKAVTDLPAEQTHNSLKPSEAVTIYPSRPPPGVQGQHGQAKRQQRLQRQKEIDTFYRGYGNSTCEVSSRKM